MNIISCMLFCCDFVSYRMYRFYSLLQCFLWPWYWSHPPGWLALHWVWGKDYWLPSVYQSGNRDLWLLSKWSWWRCWCEMCGT